MGEVGRYDNFHAMLAITQNGLHIGVKKDIGIAYDEQSCDKSIEHT